LRQPLRLAQSPDKVGTPLSQEGIRGVDFMLGQEVSSYTLLMAGDQNANNATVYEHLNFNFVRDTTPIASITVNPLLMLVNPLFPAATVPVRLEQHAERHEAGDRSEAASQRQ
jgi:hypothetical protein